MKKYMLLTLTFVVLVLGLGCGNIQKQLNTVMTFEQSAQGYVQQLTLTAQTSVMALPPDKQKEYYAKITEVSDRLTAALAAKDKALQDAIAANSIGGVDFGKLTLDVLEAVKAFSALVALVGDEAAKVKAQAASASLIDQHIRVKAVLSQ
jgi:hypothetical protein